MRAHRGETGNYPELVTNEGADTGFGRAVPNRFGQLPDPASQDDSGALEEWPIDDLDDWPFDDPAIDVAALQKSLLEAEADLAAGRTFSAEDIRARYGLPRLDAE
ncbi:hypothetical protein DVS77_32400 [Mycolicibacterium moriokaense]|nr:hypothetical protein DVS77_32400 [Mycolicibacterium moriokaense]